MNVKRPVAGFLIIVFLGALLTLVYWPLLIVAAVIGGYFMENAKTALSAFLAGICAWMLLFARYFLSGHFGAVNSFINSVAGLPALPVTLVIGGILSLLGALIGITLYKILKK